MKTFISIDWDYFVDATTEERMMLFPDGGNENLASYLSDMIWASRYAFSIVNSERNASRAISDIDVLEKDYRYLKEYLTAQQKTQSSVIVADSHAAAYRMFTEQLGIGEKCNIINIDYHHDLYANSPGIVDCGNWLSEMQRQAMLNKVYWVARTDSDDLPTEYQACDNIIQTSDLCGTLNAIATVDGIFICRSPVWSPPHLDISLIMLIKALSKRYKINGVKLPNRYNQGFKVMVTQQHNLNKQVMEKFDIAN